MLFMQGKDRAFERMMQEKPNWNKGRGSGGDAVGYRYTCEDVDCRFCDENKACGHELCPHIIENLDDLVADNEFMSAVHHAEQCNTAQRATLLVLKSRFEGGEI